MQSCILLSSIKNYNIILLFSMAALIFIIFLISNSWDYSFSLSTCHSSLLAIFMLQKIFSEGKKILKKGLPLWHQVFWTPLLSCSSYCTWNLGNGWPQKSTAAACPSVAGCQRWKIHNTFSRVPLHCLETGASSRLGNYSPQFSIMFKRLLHNAAGKTAVIIQHSLNNLNTKISYNIKNTKD